MWVWEPKSKVLPVARLQRHGDDAVVSVTRNSSLYFKPGDYVNHNATFTLSDIIYGVALLKTLKS